MIAWGYENLIEYFGMSSDKADKVADQLERAVSLHSRFATGAEGAELLYRAELALRRKEYEKALYFAFRQSKKEWQRFCCHSFLFYWDKVLHISFPTIIQGLNFTLFVNQKNSFLVYLQNLLNKSRFCCIISYQAFGGGNCDYEN